MNEFAASLGGLRTLLIGDEPASLEQLQETALTPLAAVR